jgi:hypothetical protein
MYKGASNMIGTAIKAKCGEYLAGFDGSGYLQGENLGNQTSSWPLGKNCKFGNREFEGQFGAVEREI